MSNIKVSVIIPVYNQEDFLESCLGSLAVQTLNSIEVIVIDDGSTDKSLKIATTYQKQYNFFKVISLEKSGQSAARNEGIRNANGEYIGFVDSDDFIDPVMFEQLYRTAIDYESELVKCGAILFESDSKQIIGSRTDFKAFTEISSPLELLERYLNGKLDRVVWNGLYHKRLFKNIQFPDVASYSDQYVTPNILAEANSYIYMPQNLYFYRQHSGALSYKRTNKERIERLQSLNELYKIMRNHQLLDSLAEVYSKYFFNLINGYHNQVMYSDPFYLKKNRYSADNLIDREVFKYVFSRGYLKSKQIRFLKLMNKSHYLYFLVQKLDRIKGVLLKGEKIIQEPGTRRGEKIDIIRDRYREIIQRYA